MRIAEGSQDAFGHLYDRTAPLLYATASLHAQDPQSAEHRLEQAYAKIWATAPAYRSGAGALAWLLHQTRQERTLASSENGRPGRS